MEIEGEGQLNTAVRDGDLIRRYPKHRFGVERLAFEVRLLEHVSPHLGDVVPVIVDVDLDLPVGEAFVAHKRIPGTVLRAEDVSGMPRPQLRRVSAHVAAFLREFHGLVKQGREAGVPEMSPSDFAAALTAEVDQLLPG